MKPVEYYYDWFRAAAEDLPEELRNQVYDILNDDRPRQVLAKLYPLSRAGRLPPDWAAMLGSFYSDIA